MAVLKIPAFAYVIALVYMSPCNPSEETKWLPTKPKQTFGIYNVSHEKFLVIFFFLEIKA